MAKICPWCCEPLSREQGEALLCAYCRHSLVADNGSELSLLDLRYEGLKGAQEARFRNFVGIGTPLTVGIGLLVPFTHVGAAVVIPLMVVAHLIAVRFILIRDARRYLRPSRRFFSRWMVRLAFLWAGGIGYGAAVVPIVGALSAGLTFAALTWSAHNYVLWSLWREKAKIPLALWERVVLSVLFLLTLGVIVFLVVTVALVGWSVSYLFRPGL
ncbi:MAG: hypothetical protein K8R59_14195 [Thermoanaerobaculales bacterium]|nr:hypothetical protein [Thermoanaerobaculales bacterium]